MTHYLYDAQTLSSLESNFPHSPANDQLSIQDYLEDKLANGYDLVTFSWYSTSEMQFVFRVVAK